MGYKGNVNKKFGVPIDLLADVENTIGKEIELSFFPEIPKGEKRYLLKDAKVGIEVRGAFIHFVLEDNGKEVEFLISGIKDFEYDINPGYKKYWVSVSDDLLNEVEEDATIIPHQYGEKTYRFMLFN